MKENSYKDMNYIWDEIKIISYVDHFENADTRITYREDGTATIRL